MKKMSLGAALLLSGLAACSTQHDRSSAGASISPVQAIELAAAQTPGPAATVVEFTVKGSGRQDGMLYLNSEADYREQLNVSATLLPSAQAQLSERYGPDLESALKGRRVAVRGIPRRVQVWFFADGVKTDKFYYQTQIAVSEAGQLVLLNRIPREKGAETEVTPRIPQR